ncbi:SOS response-associated peptidase family protein [Streptomyces caniferus]|uniref:SOS response-associated peptidase family protein n=1 Tax=Streptomyces caniferus TaxID=285557 RepID=UPI00381BD589
MTGWNPDLALEASWNVAPTDDAWSVLERVGHDTGEIHRQLRPLGWGLVPPWAKSLNTGAKMINARAETASTLAALTPCAERMTLAQLIELGSFWEWNGPSCAFCHGWSGQRLTPAQHAHYLSVAGDYRR